MASTKLPSLEQLKTSLAKCQGKMAEMLQAITDALTEIEEAKADKTELDDLVKQLAYGNLTFGLYTPDGKVLCTSDGAQLTAEKHI